MGVEAMTADRDETDDGPIKFALWEGIDLSARYWGPTRNITEAALAALASRLVAENDHVDEYQSCTLLSRYHGCYNSAYILRFQSGLKVCVRVPACGWSERWNEYDKELLRSTILTMRMLNKKTKLPLPQVIAHDCSFENEIGAPFILTSCIAGTSAAQAWNANESPTAREVLRQNMLRSIAQAMVELRHFKYSKSGSLWFATDSEEDPAIGESWILKIEGYIIKRDFEVVESYYSTKDRVRKSIQDLLEREGFPAACRDHTTKGLCELYQLITEAFFTATEVPDTGETFVLNHRDFDIQNMMVDNEGNLTGILDWDGLSAQPRQIGWSMVPFWLQSDWYPGYRWPPANGATDAMVRPDEYEKYRQDYAQYLWEACHGADDCRFTTKSHIYRAFFNSIRDPFAARRFVENVLAEILPRSRGLAYCTQIGEFGFMMGEKEWLQQRLHAFFAPEPPRGVASSAKSRGGSISDILAAVRQVGNSSSHTGAETIQGALARIVVSIGRLLEFITAGLFSMSERRGVARLR